MKFCRVLLAVVALGPFANLNADDATKSTEKKCDKCPASATAANAVATATKCEGEKCAAGKCCEGGQCSAACGAAIANAKEKLPKLVYKVGKETTCCSESAKALAEKSKETVQFVVAEKAYTCKNEAFTALVTETEKFVESYVSVSKCEASGKSTVAGKSFDCCVEAGQKAELVKAAVKEVRVSYKVGDEDACCAGSAAALAKKSKMPIKYVVNGEATECELTSRLNLATAKYLAAVVALTSAEKTAEAPVTLKKSDS
jgi:hypothetical protein